MITAEYLAQIAAWARELSPEEIERARRGILERSVVKGAYIFHRGDRFDHWIGVVDGLVKIGTVSSAGKTIAFAGIRSGGWFGEGTLLKNEARLYDLVALRDSRLALLNRETFFWLFEHSAGFNRFLVRQLNERLGQFIAAVEYERLLDIDSRVARAVSSLFNEHLYPGIGTKLEISQEEIGLLAGISRQRANQALKVLEQQGLVRVDYGEIEVLDLEGLRQYGE